MCVRTVRVPRYGPKCGAFFPYIFAILLVILIRSSEVPRDGQSGDPGLQSPILTVSAAFLPRRPRKSGPHTSTRFEAVLFLRGDRRVVYIRDQQRENVAFPLTFPSTPKFPLNFNIPGRVRDCRARTYRAQERQEEYRDRVDFFVTSTSVSRTTVI